MAADMIPWQRTEITLTPSYVLLVAAPISTLAAICERGDEGLLQCALLEPDPLRQRPGSVCYVSDEALLFILDSEWSTT